MDLNNLDVVNGKILILEERIIIPNLHTQLDVQEHQNTKLPHLEETL